MIIIKRILPDPNIAKNNYKAIQREHRNAERELSVARTSFLEKRRNGLSGHTLEMLDKEAKHLEVKFRIVDTHFKTLTLEMENNKQIIKDKNIEDIHFAEEKRIQEKISKMNNFDNMDKNDRLYLQVLIKGEDITPGQQPGLAFSVLLEKLTAAKHPLTTEPDPEISVRAKLREMVKNDCVYRTKINLFRVREDYRQSAGKTNEDIQGDLEIKHETSSDQYIAA